MGHAGEGRRSVAARRPGKAIVRELKIVKRVDSASTPLMSALRTNEMITKAVLTLRKAGKTQLEFLKITIEQGRVTALTVEAGDERPAARSLRRRRPSRSTRSPSNTCRRARTARRRAA